MSKNLVRLQNWINNSPITLKPGVEPSQITGLGLGLAYTSPDDPKVNISGKNEEENDKEKVILTVPKELILTADRIKELSREDLELKAWIESDNCQGNDLLHRGLLYYWLCDTHSPWRGYFDSLPKYIELPFSYSIKKMEGLDFSSVSLHHMALAKRLKTEIAYERFIKTNISTIPITLEQWLLPHSWISSRGISHPKTGKASIVPVIDLCNHSSKHSNCRYDINENEDFELLLTKTITSKQQCELLINYGDRSTAEFLFNYGFIPEGRNEEDLDEIFKVFDPSVDEIRDLLDVSRYNVELNDDERHELSLSYDVLLEFFADHIPQVLRLVRLPSFAEPDKAKRFRFHCNFIMALACDQYLEIRNIGSNTKALYFNDIEVYPDTIFETVQKLNNEKILNKARALVAKLANYFLKQVSEVSNDDPLILQLAKAESLLYKQYADTYGNLGRSSATEESNI